MPIIKTIKTGDSTSKASETSDLLFIPGWGLSYKYCEEMLYNAQGVDKSHNAYFIDSVGPNILTELEEFLDNRHSPIQLIGLSLGALIATDLAKRYPTLISSLHLISCRPSYPRAEIQAVRQGLEKLGRGYLQHFFKACFSNKDDWLRFKDRDFIAEDNSDSDLYWGLGYLEEHPLAIPETISDAIHVYHGNADRIAPIDESQLFWKAAQKTIKIDTYKGGHLASKRNKVRLKLKSEKKA